MSAKYINTITASSSPEYGYVPFCYVTGNYWDQADWIAWHKSLVTAYGIDQANILFLQGWNGCSYPVVAHMDFRDSGVSANDDFIAYAKTNGFYDGLFSGVLGTIGKVESSALGGTQSAATAISNIASSFESVSSYLLPVAIITGIVFTIYYFKKHKLT